jgi:phosphoserine aminotransferase
MRTVFARRVISRVPPLARGFNSSRPALHRVSNFNAGPAGLPLGVLETAQKDLTNFQGSGMSVMELSHRSKEFDGIIKTAEKDLRDLLKVPDNYKVLFVQGGASSQFAAVPLNLFKDGGSAEYLVTGGWSKKAFAEAKKYGNPEKIVDASDKNFTYIPEQSSWPRSTKTPAYLHYCANETVHGVEFPYYPSVAEGQALVGDFSSNFCSGPIDVSKFGVIYAGAQKNVAPSGMTVVIVREDLLGDAADITPTMFDYATQAKNDSLYNTPPCWTIYMAGLNFQHLKELGGLDTMLKINQEKAATLYDLIDGSDFFHSPVEKSVRSKMNVPFRVGRGQGDEELEAKFIKEATQEGMVGLKGHRSVGGCRASIYNSVTLEDIHKLADFMVKFEKNN